MANNKLSDGSEIVQDLEKVGPNTLFIEVSTGKYPVTLSEIAKKFTDRSFSVTPPRVDIQDLGYEVVFPSLKPEGDVVSEGQPELVSGKWVRTWVARDYNEEEKSDRLNQRKSILSSEVMRIRDDDFELGVTYQLAEAVSFNVQLRQEDRINLLLLNIQAKEAIAAENTSVEYFRSYENVTYELTPVQLVEMTDLALVAIKSIYAQSWLLKDTIEAATTLEELPELPVTFIPLK